MSLEARNLTFRYPRRGRQPVLEHVSLTLEPGERLGLSAPSGRGQTTLCQLLAADPRPAAGPRPPARTFWAPPCWSPAALAGRSRWDAPIPGAGRRF